MNLPKHISQSARRASPIFFSDLETIVLVSMPIDFPCLIVCFFFLYIALLLPHCFVVNTVSVPSQPTNPVLSIPGVYYLSILHTLHLSELLWHTCMTAGDSTPCDAPLAMCVTAKRRGCSCKVAFHPNHKNAVSPIARLRSICITPYTALFIPLFVSFTNTGSLHLYTSFIFI